MANLKTTIDKVINELGTRIIYRDIDSGGKAYIQLNLIVVNPNLPQEKQEQIILHELEHIKRKHSKTLILLLIILQNLKQKRNMEE